MRELIQLEVAPWLLACAVGCGSDGGDEAAPSAADLDEQIAEIAELRAQECMPDTAFTYEAFGRDFMSEWCLDCHSSSLSGDARNGAPASANYDTVDGIRERLFAIYTYAADDAVLMPPSGSPAPTIIDRRFLGAWLACGAP